MRRPSLPVQLLGFPPVTFALLALYGYIFWQSYEERMPFILALVAFFAAWKTIRAYDAKRAYKDWERRVRAIEEEGRGLIKAPGIIRRGTVVCVILAVIAILVAMVYQPDGNVGALAIAGVKWLAGLYLGVTFVRLLVALYRRRAKRKANSQLAKCESPFVEWTLAVPSESPTRAMAERELPDYCAGLIQREAAERT
jgi:hypothetical protein